MEVETGTQHSDLCPEQLTKFKATHLQPRLSESTQLRPITTACENRPIGKLGSKCHQMVHAPMVAQMKEFPQSKPSWNYSMVSKIRRNNNRDNTQSTKLATSLYVTSGSHATTQLLLGRGTDNSPEKLLGLCYTSQTQGC